MHIFTAEHLAALFTLTSLEIVLGVDNIVFIAIVAGRLPKEQREKARVIGLTLAIVTRLLLLMTISWIASLTTPLFSISFLDHSVSGRDLILIGGGLFLIWKGTKEIHSRTTGDASDVGAMADEKRVSFPGVITQILLIDMIFSLDSVITAVGMSNEILVMAAAVILSVGVMLLCSKAIVDFIDRYPTIKMLALAFLLLIGVMLVAEGCGRHMEKGYIYFAMAFSLGVELLNLRAMKKKGDKILQ